MSQGNFNVLNWSALQCTVLLYSNLHCMSVYKKGQYMCSEHNTVNYNVHNTVHNTVHSTCSEHNTVRFSEQSFWSWCLCIDLKWKAGHSFLYFVFVVVYFLFCCILYFVFVLFALIWSGKKCIQFWGIMSWKSNATTLRSDVFIGINTIATEHNTIDWYRNVKR